MNNVTCQLPDFPISQGLTLLVMWEAIVWSWSRKRTSSLHPTVQLAENHLFVLAV